MQKHSGHFSQELSGSSRPVLLRAMTAQVRLDLAAQAAEDRQILGWGSARRPAWAGWLPARRAALAGEWRVGALEPAGIRCGLYFYAERLK